MRNSIFGREKLSRSPALRTGRLFPFRHKHLRRNHCLPNMPLRMIRDVNQQPAYRRWQLFLAHGSKRIQSAGPCRTHTQTAALQPLLQLFEQLRMGGPLCHLRLQSRHLRRIQFPAFRIRQQPVNAAGNVPQMKRHRSQPMRRCIQLFIAQVRRTISQLFGRQLQRMQNCPRHRRNFVVSSTKPGFRRRRTRLRVRCWLCCRLTLCIVHLLHS